MPAEVLNASKDYSEQKSKIINRLKRLEGQVRGLQAMVEEERDCHDMLTLLSGIRSALNATGDIILATYLEKCQTDLKKGRGDIDELVEAVKLARG
jgi:CsoR family transcriptional regulator, copper-sensing transcriptional repressor